MKVVVTDRSSIDSHRNILDARAPPPRRSLVVVVRAGDGEGLAFAALETGQ